MSSEAAALTGGSSAARDPDALVASLFASEGAALVRMARLFTDDRTAAEDLVQEAFVRLIRSAERIREPDRAVAYLRSIVLNLARDHNRRGLMSMRHRDAQRLDTTPEPLVADRIEADAGQAVILDALRDLPPRQRDCLVLRFYLELSSAEIAEVLGITVNSVKTHARRGLDALRSTIGEEIP
jgi:RNA polymerase sigma-70 factor (sigma-E family)